MSSGTRRPVSVFGGSEPGKKTSEGSMSGDPLIERLTNLTPQHFQGGRAEALGALCRYVFFSFFLCVWVCPSEYLPNFSTQFNPILLFCNLLLSSLVIWLWYSSQTPLLNIFSKHEYSSILRYEQSNIQVFEIRATTW